MFSFAVLISALIIHSECVRLHTHPIKGSLVPGGRSQGGAFMSTTHGSQKMYNWGGRQDCANNNSTCINLFFDNVFTYDFGTKSWFEATQTGSFRPTPRSTFAYAGWANQDSMIVFGGTTYNGTSAAPSNIAIYPDLLRMTPQGPSGSSVTWTALNNTNGPGARAGSAIQVVGDTLYLFGGLASDFATHNDLWTYNLLTQQWTLLTPSGTLPDARYLHALVYNPDQNVFVLLGGDTIPSNKKRLDDVWTYSPDTNTWTFITRGVQTSINGVAASIGDICMFGFGEIRGGGDGWACVDSVTKFDSNPTDRTWITKLQPEDHPAFDLVTFEKGPGNMKMMNYLTFEDKLYFSFGFNWFCVDDGKGSFQYNSYVISLAFSQLVNLL